jgi:hypothetical protein
MILRQASILIAVGLGVGLLLAFPAQPLIQSFLYQVHALDMWTYVSALLVLPGIGLVAALLPAQLPSSRCRPCGKIELLALPSRTWRRSRIRISYALMRMTLDESGD